MRTTLLFAGAVVIGFLLWNHVKVYGYFARAGDHQVKSAGIASALQNDRLKLVKLSDYPINDEPGSMAMADGVWISDIPGPDHKLVQPQQVSIQCMANALFPDEHKKGECSVRTVTLGVIQGMVDIMGPDEDVFEITDWNKDRLSASYDDGKCHLQILTMTFAIGRVLVSDIPTNKPGCEAFTTTNSYHLVRGQYYVDTTEKNDGDKPS